MCQSPPFHFVENVPIFVYLAESVGWVDSGLTFQYINDFSISHFFPLTIGRYGNDKVSLFGSGFTKDIPIFCRFVADKNSVHIPSSFIDESLIKCNTPHYAVFGSTGFMEAVSLSITSNEVDFVDAPVTLLYESSAQLIEVTPTFGPSRMRTNVFISLSSAIFDTSLLFCWFGQNPSRANFLNPKLIKCESHENEVHRDDFISSHILQLSKEFDCDPYISSSARFTYYDSAIQVKLSPSIGHPQIPEKVEINGLQSILQALSFEGHKIEPVIKFGNEKVIAYLKDGKLIFDTLKYRQEDISFNQISVGYSLNGGASFSSSEHLIFQFIDPLFLYEAIPHIIYPYFTKNILVIGANFIPLPSLICSFGGVTVSGEFIDESSIRCPVPISVVYVKTELISFSVSLNGKTFSEDILPLEIREEPNIISMEPTHIFYQGGVTVSVTGENLISGPIFFEMHEMSSNFSSTTLISKRTMMSCDNKMLCTFIAPSLMSGFNHIHYVSVFLDLGGLDHIQIKPILTYGPKYAINEISPSIGNINSGVILTVSGSSFDRSIPMNCVLSDV